MTENLRVKLHSPNNVAYFNQRRVRETNKTLNNLGFDEVDKEFLFTGYGKDGVLKALSLYIYSEANTQLRDQPNMDPEEIKSGLIATMEAIRTEKLKNTETLIFQGHDILEYMQRKYEHRKPAIRVRNNDSEKREVIEYLVEKYITNPIQSVTSFGQSMSKN